MTMRFVDSFDGYATSNMSKKWTTAGGTITTTNARRGSCLSLGNQAEAAQAVPDAATNITQFYHYVSSLAGITGNAAGSAILGLEESGTRHLTAWINSSGQIGVTRGGLGGTVLGQSATGVIQAGVGAHIAIKANIHDSTGTVEIRINGSSSPVLNLSGQDTRNGGASGVVNVVRLVGLLNTSYFDDLVVMDSAGSKNNNFIGDRTVIGAVPTGNGTYGDFTSSSGGGRYTNVDEADPNTTDYNSSGTSGNKDTFTFPALPSNVGAIDGACVNLAALKDDAGAMNHQAYCKSSSSESAGTSVALSTAQRIDQHIYELNPNGSANWTKSAVDAAEFGYKIP